MITVAIVTVLKKQNIWFLGVCNDLLVLRYIFHYYLLHIRKHITYKTHQYVPTLLNRKFCFYKIYITIENNFTLHMQLPASVLSVPISKYFSFKIHLPSLSDTYPV